MKRCVGLMAALWAAVALAAPGTAHETFAGCPAGTPRQDVIARPIPAEFWQAPVLAVFWSVDCAFCHRHNERLNQLLKAEPKVAVLGIAIDGSGAKVKATVKQRGYAFPVIADDCGLRAQLTPRKLVPMTCWLGASPTQPRCIPGEMTEDDLRELLRHARHSW